MKKFFQLLTIFIGLSNASYAQYCAAGATSTADEEITNFTFATINNTTNCTTPLTGTMGPAAGGTPSMYADFTSVSPATVLGGATYPFSLTIASCNVTNWSSGSKIYIDYNQNSLFTDPGEEVYWSGTAPTACVPPTTLTGNITIPITATPGITRLRAINVEGGQASPTTINPCGTFTWGEVEDYRVNIIPPVPCNATPFAGTIVPASPVSQCPTNALNIFASNSTLASGLVYQWQRSVNSGVTWTNIAGATSLNYLIPAGTPSAWYRMISICTSIFAFDTTDVLVVNVVNPTYANLPYTQGFENWTDYCANQDVPNDGHWLSTPNNGDLSWRRDDEGVAGNWIAAGSGAYLPVSSEAAHSARFHSFNNFSSGTLDLYINTGGNPNSTLLFDYINKQGNDQLDIEISTNGGVTFSPALTVFNANAWTTDAILLPIASSQTIIRFTGIGDFSDDIGLDNIRVLPPCNAVPNAGVIHDTTVCPNRDFTMFTTGSTLAGGIDFEWQTAPTATGPWTTIGNTISNSIVTQIPAVTFFRVITTCLATGQSDTTAVEDILLKDFYYCYCNNSFPTSSFDGLDIGNVQLKKGPTFLIDNLPLGPLDTLNNPNAVNIYTNYQYLSTTPTIFVDSAYIINTTAITDDPWSPFGSARIFIDYNRDGLFDPTFEVAAGASLNNSQTANIFTVPTTAQQGFTGLRVVLSDVGSASSIQPCGPYNSGETEDYLVYLSLPPCSAPTNAGLATISDTLICPGYNITVTDTTHTSIAAYNGLSTIWQQSATGVAGTFTDIPGATADTYTFLAASNTFLRMKIVCKPGAVALDSSVSNVVKLIVLPSSTCYPASGSTGSSLDSNDLGAFILGSYSFVTGGPHVGNPAAVRNRTDYAPFGSKQLYTDSTYDAAIFSILKPFNHADSRITVFIDYNNNGVYDIPAERVYTGLSTNTSFYLPFSFTTISNPVLGVPTGMRVILNNNILPNAQSDLGVGLYTSGETEDYSVIFTKKVVIPTSLSSSLELKNISIYPNPTTGLVYLDISSINLEDLKINVTNILGQELLSKSYTKVGNQFHTLLDLSNFAKGTYLIKISSDKGSSMQKVTLK
jgi:hypothetical protein